MQIPGKMIDWIKQPDLLEIELQGEIPEVGEKSVVPFFPRKRRMTVWDIEKVFFHASIAHHLKAVLIKIRGLEIGIAVAEAIRRGISGLKECGKRVFVYLESPGNVEYMIGSAADRVFILPWATLNLIGLKAEVTFFKDALDKLGIEADFRALGEFKSAAETFTRQSMSESNKEMMNSIVGDLYSQFTENLSLGRKIPVEKIKSLIDQGPFTPEEALKEGLVDGLVYEDVLESEIAEELGLKPQKVSAEGFLRTVNIKERIRAFKEILGRKYSVIAVVSDSGIITLGQSRGSGGTKTLGSKTLVKMLKKAAGDANVKAVVLRILSPGGSGAASDLIWHEIKVISRKKPVVVSMSDVAASGGYLIALGASKIVAEPLTLTGSIGVVSGKFNLKDFLARIGIAKDSVSRGKRASMFSISRGFTKSEGEKLVKIMKSLYDDFVQKVAGARGMDFDSAERLAKGRVWTGKQAKELGLIDELGGLREAIELAKKEAGISADAHPIIKFISKPKGLELSLLGRELAWKSQVDSAVQALTAIQRETVFTLMPFWMKIK